MRSAGISSAFLASWPWAFMGTYKYWIAAPFVLRFFYAKYLGGYDADNWCFHMVLLCALRCLLHQLCMSFSRLHCLVKWHQIDKHATSFEQVDREFDWDNPIILQGLLAVAAHTWAPGFSDLPLWNIKGLVYVAIFHILATEPLYYWIHRELHSNLYLFKNYHSLHHATVVPEPSTAGTGTFLEHGIQALLVSMPLLAASVLGEGSISMVYLYFLGFDLLKQLGHLNCEVVPAWLFKVPFLKYLLYTPSYHSLHHKDMKTNFCLFMPLFDHLGGTVHPKTQELYLTLRQGRKQETPDFIFLAHIIDLMSNLQTTFVFRTLAAEPYEIRWFMYLCWMWTLPFMAALWAWGRNFVANQYKVGTLLAETRVIPRYGFHFFLPFGKKSINAHIEQGILDAERAGVKVVSLAALNKNEELNGGGVLFWKKYTDLRVRIVHGNTLTAAVVINEINIRPDVQEVFLTGSTSKIGRALALHLCRKGIRVLMFTNARDRYEAILKEAPPQYQHNLVQVTKYQAGQNCKTWIVGKWIFAKDQACAPPGTFFHQFVVPPVPEIRKDCTYGKLSGMRLPKNISGLSSCEFTMPRGVVHACHAGGLLHALEGWKHHEIGSIDIERIDEVWKAALRQGFTPYV